MKTDLFRSCGHCWVFQIWWHIECSTFTASSFKIWNSSTGIPLLPLSLFIVITPLWLSGSWRSFFYSSSVYSCHLFLILIFCFCWVHTLSVLYCAHLCMKYSLGISDFLDEISSLPPFCFPLFFCIIFPIRFSIFEWKHFVNSIGPEIFGFRELDNWWKIIWRQTIGRKHRMYADHSTVLCLYLF